jgi:hypothetical protein
VRTNFQVIEIIFETGSTIEHDITRWIVEDHVLHLFYRNGEMAPELHVMSYPVVHLRAWKRRSKYGEF